MFFFLVYEYSILQVLSDYSLTYRNKKLLNEFSKIIPFNMSSSLLNCDIVLSAYSCEV